MIRSTPGLDPSIEANQKLFVFGLQVLQGRAAEVIGNKIVPEFKVRNSVPKPSNDLE